MGAEPVRHFPVMMDLVASTYVPLDATSDQSTPTLGRSGPSNSARYILLTYIVTLTNDQHQRQTGRSTLAITFPTWMLCCHSVTHDETN